MADWIQLAQLLAWLATIGNTAINAEKMARERHAMKLNSKDTDKIIQGLTIVPSGILDVHRARLDDVVNDYAEAIRGATPLEIKMAYRNVSYEVCALLKSLKRHNQGRLPDGEVFEQLWKTFSCV